MPSEFMYSDFINPETLSKELLERGTDFAPKFDANGLIMAIATEHGTNEVLMVAHMNAEALRLTLETQIVHYYSRSRAKLWKKGETSGEIQNLVEIRTDCDQDVLLLKVEQAGRGAACHTGQKSCFYRTVEQNEGKLSLKNDDGPPLFDPAEIYNK